MPYVQLSRFVFLIQAVAGAGLLAGAVRRRSGAEASLLLLLGTGVLAVSALAGWILFYLGLASRIPFTPGAMCIFGVLRAGSPALRWAEVGFPSVLVVAGAGMAAYLLEHRAGDPGRVRLRAVLAASAAGALVHGAIGLWGWQGLLHPRAGQVLSVSCCTTVFDVAEAGRAVSWGPGPAPLWSGVAGLAGLAGLAALSRPRPFPGRTPVWAGVLGATALVALGAPALVLERWAPDLMGLIDHHCPYCLIQRVAPAGPATLMGSLAAASALWGAWIRLYRVGRPDLRHQGIRLEAGLARAALWSGLSAAGMLAAYAAGKGVWP